jgi:hypothetical protein
MLITAGYYGRIRMGVVLLDGGEIKIGSTGFLKYKLIQETRSYFAKQHLRLSYELYNIKVSLSGGYFIDLGDPFHLEDEKEKKLMNYQNEEVTSGWNGFTTGLNVYFIL